MRAAIYRGPGEITVEEVPRPEIESPTDAIVRVTHTAVCGSDLWFYRGQSDREEGSRVGHEPMGIVEEVGDDVRSVEPGDRVFAPFVISCGRCEFCRKGLHTSCVNGDSWGGDNGGGQGEYVRATEADGTLVRVPDRHADDEDTLEAILPLTDVMGTGHHAAVSAGVSEGDTCIVVGDGAVGLCGVLAARRLGAERIIAMGHHEDRLELAESFGATETIAARGQDAVDAADDLTNGGANHVLECVGAASAMETAIDVCRPGGTVATSVSRTASTTPDWTCSRCSATTSRSTAASHRFVPTPTNCWPMCCRAHSTRRRSSRKRRPRRRSRGVSGDGRA